MATVLQRFTHLGLAHNNKILMIVGVEVANKFLPYTTIEREGWGRKSILQKEGDQEFTVWDYPNWWVKEMDAIIINFLNHYLDAKIN